MTKNQYLAELRNLLSYMTPDDRIVVLRRYSCMFDECGEENVVQLISEIGSPTKLAIVLFRTYVPGCECAASESVSNVENAEPTDDSADASSESSELEETQDLGTDMPKQADEEASTVDEESFREPEMVSDEEVFAEPICETALPILDEAPAKEQDYALSDFPEIEPQAQPESDKKSAASSRVVLAALLAIIPGIPIALLALAASIVLLAPGIAALAAAVLTFIGGLWSMAYVADMLLIFGAALIITALGILLLFFGVIAVIKLWAAFCSILQKSRRRILYGGGADE